MSKFLSLLIFTIISFTAFTQTPTVTGVSTETCVGGNSGTITASGSSGTSPYTYSLNGGAYQSSTLFSGLSAGTYMLNIMDNLGATGSANVTVNDFATSPDNQNAAATDSWIGHMYDGTNFSNYIGYFSEAETFNEGFGGSYNCFNVTSNLLTSSIYTETISVKYKMNSTRRGLYVIDLGSDDGSRLTVDGSLLYNNWSDQAFSTRPNVLMNLTGSSNLLYEFYENGGGNQVIFQNLNLVLSNTLSANTTQNICIGGAGTAVSGDVYGTLPTGISLSGTGYQWSYSTTPGGLRTNISGATAATYTPSTLSAPFNVAGIYYLYRNAVLSSSNNVSPNPYVASNESNAATITVNPLPTATITGTSSVCIGSSSPNITFTGANGTTPYTFIYKINGGANQTLTTTSGNSVTVAVSTASAGSFIYSLVSVAGVNCSQAQPGSATITVNSIPAITGNTPGSRCGTGTVTLSATASAGTINWYAASTGGSSLATGTSFTTPSISTTTTYWADATNNGCTTASRTPVIATTNNVNVTATLGTLSGCYSTLKAAFDNINNGTHKGVITISINSNTIEAASAALNASGSGSASYSAVTVQPAGGVARTISGSIAAPLIDLNGADNVTIDGLNTGGNSLTISNASTSNLTNTSTIRFIQDATNNTISNCTIEGSETSTSLATIFFSNGTAAVVTGNDDNTISNNILKPAGGNLPANAIYSAGKSVAIDNSGISVINNNIQDYYSPMSASNGIFVASNSAAWTITGNKLFQTAIRTCTVTGYIHRAINIVTTAGSSYIINNNIIGYANASATGVTSYDGAFANRFVGIEMTVATTGSSNVQGNIITSINLSTTASTSAGTGIFTGISVLNGNVNIGTTSANTIGVLTGNNSITVSSTISGASLSGIYAASTGTVSIQNNNIGSISTNGAATIGFTLYGINTSGTNGDFTITGNTIGSIATASSISAGNMDGTTSAICTFNGISNSSTGPASIIDNTIKNCSVFSTGGSVFYGIKNSGSTGTLNITSNAIRIGTNTGTGSSICISNTAAAATININSNVIRSYTSTGAAGAFIGISNTGAASSAINIINNQLGNSNGGALTFTNASTGTITGIINNAGTATTTVSITDNLLQGFAVVSSGAFIGISNAGATGVAININNNQLGSSSAGTLAFSAATGTITGITNSGGTSNTIVSIYNNSLLGFSGTSSGAFIGISNSVAGSFIDITYNQVGTATSAALTFSNASTAAITGILNSGGSAGSTVNLNNNSIQRFAIISCTAAFTGISNTGAAGVAININNNLLGDNGSNVFTVNNASTGNITGISNNAGISTTEVSISNNSLQGFSVVSSGVFTGIINAGNLTGVSININSNQIGTSTGNAVTYSGANSSALYGISNTGGASTCVLSIQSNDIRRIVHSVAGTSTHNYIINSAATLSQNISTNTFTNLDVNTTGAITFISNNVIVSATGGQTVDGNSISGIFTRTNTSASGVLTLFNSTASSASGSVITNSDNNFSNITVSGTATIAGWINTDAGNGTKTIRANTFNNWAGGTGVIVAMNINISGAGNVVSGNVISNINSGANITGITTGAGNDNVFSNTISSLISTGPGATIVTGIVVSGGTAKNISDNTINGLQANNSDIGGGGFPDLLSVNGIWVAGGNTINVYDNRIYGFTADAINSGTINGIIVSGGTTVTASRNKIYNMSSNSTAINAGGISGFMVFNVAGSNTNIINNIIGDFRTPFTNNTDAFRGITITTTTASNINVYNNTIYLNSTSSATDFGCTGIYHAGSANAAIGQLDLRNNIISNISAPKGSGLIVAMRQYQTGVANYASTSNNNLFYSGSPGPNRVIYNDYFSSSDQTLSVFKARLGNREGQSFTEDVTVNFLSLIGSSPYFLHIDSTICTRLESGGANISGVTDDFDKQIRQGNPGYIGSGSAPDIGADEFEGNAIPTAVLSGTATICKGSSTTLSLAVIGNGTISGKLSDSTFFSGTAPTITVNVSPTATTTYTIATFTNSNCSSATSDKMGSAVITVNARATATISGTQTICGGGSATLSLAVAGSGTLSGTLSDGTTFSGTAPTITISVSPLSTTTYTIASLNNSMCASIGADKTGSATVTVTPLPSATISYMASPYCSDGGTASVTFTGTTGGIYTSTAGLTINSATGAITLGTSINGNYVVTYKVAAAGGCSQYQTTSTISIVTPGTWTGTLSTNWNTSNNWVCGSIPSTNTNVIIPGGLSKYPLINLITASVNNLAIQPGGCVTVSGGNLQIAGSINNSGTLNAANGAIEMNGTGSQTIPASAFQNNSVNDLVINNSSVTGVTLAGTLDIYGSLTYIGINKILNTNDLLTLKSTATNTAWVGDMTGNTITGKVTVERYISARKAWRFLSVPTNTTQTIRDTWQEGCGANGNCVANFGTQITGAGGIAAGFDLYTATPSLKTYNSNINNWVGVSGTGINIKATEGYMTFVRGDRAATTFNSPVTQTTLRTKGLLYTGDLPAIPVGSLKFASIGNPYAASLDARKIGKPGIKDFFYVWDPNLSGYYGLGAYQTFSYNGLDYIITPGGGSYGASGSACNFIASGQAFFVQGSMAGGTVTFKEAAKTTGSLLVARPSHAPGQELRTNLYGVNADGSTYMADGVLINYDDTYANIVDDLDAIKSVNSNENLGIKAPADLLVIERRHSIELQDTVQLNLTGERVQAYRFEVIANKLDEPGLIGYLEDSYLNIKTPLDLNGITTVNFAIANIPGSYSPTRFRIVFMLAKVLPLSITNVKAYQQNKDINVEWRVDNEANTAYYEVEYSEDGNQFRKVHATPAKNANSSSYVWTDVNASTGFDYYRIKSVDVNGKAIYSKIVKVFVSPLGQAITVFPNPVKNGMINLHFENQPKGTYGIRLVNKGGQVIIVREIIYPGGSGSQTIQLENYLPHGIYQLQINKLDNTQININMTY